ncbi:MAG TPA: BamA/TamA family outer membrane protein [Planctomycetota bacterium]|nr:BamA/TamA family outer membrane protein [Planctomycetota bacterium]
MIGFRVPLAACALVLLAVAPAAAQDQDEGRTVVAIEFVELRRLSPEAVKAQMALKEGRPFSRELLQRDIKTLVANDIFFNVREATVRPDPSGQGVIVRINGEENERVLDVMFFGMIDADREDLAPLVKTRAGGLADAFTLEIDRRDIVDWYRKKGFHYVQVEVVRSRLEGVEDGVVIVFRITEGPEVEIEEVIFEGNHSFSKGKLLKAMKETSEDGFLRDATFVLEEVQRDVVALNRFYQGEGYLDARATLMGFEPTPDFEDVTVRIRIEEGRRYFVRGVRIEGVTLLDVAALHAELETLPGAPYRPAGETAKDVRRILDRYQELAYLNADVRDAATVDLESNLVDVVIRVVEGEKIYVGEIRIRNNLETRDNVIRREIELFTGEPLNQKKLDKARRRIQALGYWEQSPRGSVVEDPVIPTASFDVYREAYVTLRDTNRENVKDVVVDVVERDTGSIRFAVGIGSNDGLIGDVTYQKNNFDPFDLPEGFGDILDAFTGGGDTLILSAAPGSRYSRFGATYVNPRVGDGPYSFRQDLYKSFYRREEWREDRLGGRTSVGRRLGEDMSAGISLRNEVVDVRRISTNAPQIVFDFEGENLVSALQLDWRLAQLDDFLDPTDGFVVTAAIEHAGLWGDIHFNQVLVEGEYYIPLGEDEEERAHVLRLDARAGWMNEYGDSHDVPVYERFFLGGHGSLRGFRFRGAGPHENGTPTGGKALWTAGAEYAYPIFGDGTPGSPNLRGVFFVDTGSLASSWSDSDIGDVRVSVGFGFRVVVPFLGPRPIAIDFGFPLRKSDGDEERLLSFSFGSNF